MNTDWFAKERDALLFTENETNVQRLYGVPNPSPHVKDAFHEAVVQGKRRRGKSGAHRNEGRGALPLHDRPGRNRVRFGCDCSESKEPGRFLRFDDFDRLCRAATRRKRTNFTARSPRAA